MSEVNDRHDLDQVFRVLLPRAREALVAAEGRLAPVGASLDAAGRLHATITGPSAEEQQPSAVVDRMIDGFCAQAARGSLRACGVAYDARVEGPAGSADAIAFWLEHESGETATIYLPYTRGANGGFEFGSLIPARGPRRVFL